MFCLTVHQPFELTISYKNGLSVHLADNGTFDTLVGSTLECVVQLFIRFSFVVFQIFALLFHGVANFGVLPNHQSTVKLCIFTELYFCIILELNGFPVAHWFEIEKKQVFFFYLRQISYVLFIDQHSIAINFSSVICKSN